MEYKRVWSSGDGLNTPVTVSTEQNVFYGNEISSCLRCRILKLSVVAVIISAYLVSTRSSNGWAQKATSLSLIYYMNRNVRLD